VRARSQRLHPDTLAFEVSHSADGIIRDQFKAANMRSSQYGDRSASVDRGYELRGKVQIEVDFVMRDGLVDL